MTPVLPDFSLSLTVHSAAPMAKAGITVIITVWKRKYLAQQLESLIRQSVAPTCIWIIQNENHIDITLAVKQWSLEFPAIFKIHSGFNLKYFGRFSVCNLVETEYVLIIDDDVIPSPSWLETCLEKCKKYNAVISCTGRIVKPGSFRPEEWAGDERIKYFIGDNQSDAQGNFLPADTQVDYGCNSYFFKTEWMRYFWSVWPVTFLSGEDIHLSASLMVTAGIATWVPQQLSETTTGNVAKSYSLDESASWRNPDFINVRESVFKYFIEKKLWTPLLWKQPVPPYAR